MYSSMSPFIILCISWSKFSLQCLSALVPGTTCWYFSGLRLLRRLGDFLDLDLERDFDVDREDKGELL